MEGFNIFSESMMTCLEGTYQEPEAIERAKELSKTTSARWVVHDSTGQPHYVAVRGDVYFVGTKQSDVYKHFVENNGYLKERVEHYANLYIEATLALGHIGFVIKGLKWELENRAPDIHRLREILSQFPNETPQPVETSVLCIMCNVYPHETDSKYCPKCKGVFGLS